MSNSNLGHVLCPFTEELAIVRANKKGKLYYVSGAGMITPACQRGQAWIKEKAHIWAEPDRPPENIRLEYDHDSRAPKPVYVNEAQAPEAPEPEPETPEPAPEQKPKPRSIISRIWEGGDDV